MRTLFLIPAVILTLIPACSGGGGGGGGTDTDADTDGTGSTSGTATDSGTGGSTGGGGSGLVPCDPLVDGDCEEGVCAGEPSNGFYCRLPCSSMAMVGDPCGNGGICLRESSINPGDTACFELDDCDFLSGEGCDLAAGESCVVIDQDPLRTACVPNGTKGNGEPCKPNGMHECEPGQACLGSDLEDMENGVCTGWCVPGDPLPDACSACQEITPEIGSCAECNIIDNDCPAGSQCQPINEALGGVCVDFGPGGDGDPCHPIDPAMSCQDGFLCLEMEEDVWTCFEKCDPKSPMCMNMDYSCNDIGLLDPNFPDGELGLCFDFGGNALCVPGQDPSGCAQDQLCLQIDANVGLCADPCDPTSGDAACTGNYSCIPTNDQDMLNQIPFAVGNGACGVGCTTDADCSGATCLLTDGIESEGICGVTCTPANPTECAMGEGCVPTTADPNVGACVPVGVSCDPADPVACAGSGTCVALDGGAAGACMPACFEQDPNACAGMADQCQVKSDMSLHTGACLGQDMACDAANQTGCGMDQTCTVIGGSAFGGAAFVCEDGGLVQEGDSCAADTDQCAAGLLCYQDTCRAWCDPANDQCPSGTCTDISANLYLPASSVGACL